MIRTLVVLLVVASVIASIGYANTNPARLTVQPMQVGEIAQRQFALSIQGEGFFMVDVGSELTYTRCGRMQVNADGVLHVQTKSGVYQLLHSICIPQNATDFTVSNDGVVTCKVRNEVICVGTIEVATFANKSRLTKCGPELFRDNPDSGAAFIGTPGTNKAGILSHRDVN